MYVCICLHISIHVHLYLFNVFNIRIMKKLLVSIEATPPLLQGMLHFNKNSYKCSLKITCGSTPCSYTLYRAV